MAQTLELENYSQLNILNVVSLDADYPAGASSLVLKSTLDLAANDYLVLGLLGQMGNELVQVQSVTNATTIALVSPTTLDHRRYEQITKLFGNQIKVYRAPNVSGYLPADVAFTSLATVSIDVPRAVTAYTDPVGDSTYWYKKTYYNSQNLAETSLADSTAQRGGGYGHYASIAEIRGEAGFNNNPNISNTLIDSRRIDAENEVETTLYGVYALPFATPVPAQVRMVVRLLAAGLLLDTEYGPMASGAKKRAEDKLAEGRAALMEIKTRGVILLDAAKNSLLIQTTVTSWPDASTDVSGSNASPEDAAQMNQDFGPVFRKSQRF